MKKTDEITVEQAFSLFFRAASARGVTDKTLQTYKHHSRALFKRCDGNVPLGELTRHDLEDWINTLREGELSEQSIKCKPKRSKKHTRFLLLFLISVSPPQTSFFKFSKNKTFPLFLKSLLSGGFTQESEIKNDKWEKGAFLVRQPQKIYHYY